MEGLRRREGGETLETQKKLLVDPDSEESADWRTKRTLRTTGQDKGTWAKGARGTSGQRMV